MNKNKILEKIKKQGLKMRPKSYFIFRTILFVLGIVLAFLFTIFIISFIVFTLRASGIWYFPAFGFRGLGLFFGSFPWLLIIFAIILVILLEIFAKKFSLVYRKPLVYSILGIIVIVFLIGIIISQTSLHRGLFMSAQQGKLPVFGPLYRSHFIMPPHNAFIGTVSDISDNGFQIKIEDGEALRVIISSETHFPFSNDVKEDDLVIVMGERENSTIKAFGVRKIEDNKGIYLNRGGHMNRPMRMK